MIDGRRSVRVLLALLATVFVASLSEFAAGDEVWISLPCSSKAGPDFDCKGNPRTPEDKAEYQKKEEASQAAERLADKKKAAFEVRVALEKARVPGNSDADARRLVTLREAAERAAGLRSPPLSRSKDEQFKQCGTQPTTNTLSNWGKNPASLVKTLKARERKHCKFVSPVQCKERGKGVFDCSVTMTCEPRPYKCRGLSVTKQ